MSLSLKWTRHMSQRGYVRIQSNHENHNAETKFHQQIHHKLERTCQQNLPLCSSLLPRSMSECMSSECIRKISINQNLLPQSKQFAGQEYWSGLPFPSLGDLPNPGIKPGSLALQADSLPSESPGKPKFASSTYQMMEFGITRFVCSFSWI